MVSSPEEDSINFGEYIGIILQYKWLILIITAICTLIGVSYSFIATPLYKADALIQIEDEQGGGLPALEDVATIFEGTTNIQAELELVSSRMVVGEAIKQLSLDINIEPKRFPVIGDFVARRFESKYPGVSKARFGQKSYAWGGEKLNVDYFNVPEKFVGQKLTLKVKQGGAYELLDSKGEILLNGVVGKVAELAEPVSDENQSEGSNSFKIEKQPKAENTEFLLFVSGLKARPGTEFLLTKLPTVKMISTIQSGLNVTEKGKKSSMLQLDYISPRPELAKDLLNTLADIYVDQNIARSSAEAQLSLNFLDEQLPPLKEQVDAAENAYNEYRMQEGSVDLAAETQSMLLDISQVSDALLELEQQRDELRKKFKPAHPIIKALDGKIRILQQENKKLDASTDNLPKKQRDILRLSRDVELNTALYTKLLNTSQELKVAKAGTVGSVRVIDYAYTPNVPVRPQKVTIIAISLMVGLGLGTFLAFVLNSLRGGVNDPDEIERKLGLSVYSAVTRSNAQVEMNKYAKKTGGQIGILAHEYPDDEAIESLRSLRTSLQFSLRQASNNIIMITGPSPNIGKTFTSINLGAVLASSGKRILVVDADLRRGTLHRYVGASRKNGLSEVITRDENIFSFIQKTAVENLAIITSGEYPPNPSELLLHKTFEDKLKQASEYFDYVIIDAPPVLAVTDAAIMGRQVGTTLLIVKDNTHHMRELEQTVQQLKHAGTTIQGVVMNDVTIQSGRYGYGKYVYRYSYAKT